MAKSFVMQGMEAGFDTSNQDDVEAWMRLHNAAMAGGLGEAPRNRKERREAAKKARKRSRR